MKKTILNLAFGLVAFIIVSALHSCQEDLPEKEGINSYVELQELWENPPADYRSAPLWDWNGKITEEGIAFQMEEFKKVGIGGVFVHPRPGLITEYISEDWHQLFDYTVQKGKELGMNVWIYDENSYPSGFSGGHVPAEMPDSYKHGTGLSIEEQKILRLEKSDTVEVVLKKTDSGFEDITANYESEIGKTGNYYIFKKTYPGKSPWYGGFSYVDLLYPGVTKKFQEVTMRGYEKYNKADFGNTLKGIFTDEPNLEAAMSRKSETVVRWTPDLWDVFEERWGYDLKNNLPSLVYEIGNWKKVRHDYYELVLELFIERWAKPNYEYCEANNLDWTGHYWEHGWPEPTHGFDEAAFYIWHQQPGVDMLGGRLDPDGLGGQFGNTRAIRELRSAANQAGRKRTLSETYGGGGYEMDFKMYKRLADWQCVFGVNFVNQHLSYYTLNGVRKFDYPPTFSYHEPWWDDYKLMGDYLARISMATSAGEQINKVLLLQPNTTAWMYFSRKNKNPQIDSIRHNFKSFVHELEKNHFEYDLGSEKVLRDLGSVDNGKLVVGKRNYRLLVIPKEMENIDQHTFNLLKEFLTQGGTIVSFTSGIERLDGEVSSTVSDLQKAHTEQWEIVNSIDDIKDNALLEPFGFHLKDLAQNQEFFHQRRQLNDGELLFMVNSSETEAASARVKTQAKSIVKIDLFTGEQNLIESEETKNGTEFNVELLPIESALYFLSDKKETFPVLENHQEIAKNPVAIENMKINRLSDNILVVDYLDIKTKKSEKKGIHFMKALNELFVENGVEFGNPWQHKIQYKQDYVNLDTMFTNESGFEVTYYFNVGKNLSAEVLEQMKAVIERPGLWHVWINGKEIVPDTNQYWIEKDFPVFLIGNYVKPGENQIRLVADRMSVFAEIMPIYILGNFSLNATEKDFEIIGSEKITTGSWINNGMPFYSQKVSYSTNLNAGEENSYFVKLDEWHGTICDVFVNGDKTGTIAFPPYELDISDKINPGQNNIEVVVSGSLKNTFGYFYHSNNNWIHGPHNWNNAPDKYPGLKGMYLMDYGLFEPFKILSSAAVP